MIESASTSTGAFVCEYSLFGHKRHIGIIHPDSCPWHSSPSLCFSHGLVKPVL
jgi:hypothetical protein